MKEDWKDINGYEGYYQISNKARIRRTKRTFVDAIGRKYSLKQRVLTQVLNTNGYYSVVLHLKGRVKCVRIHRLVAIAFIPNPHNKPWINHKNSIRTDNRISNLEWSTPSENIKHGYDVGFNHGRKGVLNVSSKPVVQLRRNREFVRDYESQNMAYSATGIGHISCACKGRRKTAGGYIWIFKSEYDREICTPPSR